MIRLKRVLWLFSCMGVLLWMACQDPVVGPEGQDAYARVEAAMFSGLRTLLKTEGVELSVAGYPTATLTVEGKPTLVEDEGKGSGDATAVQRFSLDGTYSHKISGYVLLEKKASPLQSKLGTKRSYQVAKIPCPKKVGDTWVLEGANVEDLMKNRSGSATITIGTDAVKVDITYNDGTKETIDLDLDKGSPLKKPDYAALFEQVYSSKVSELSDKAIQSTEDDKLDNVANVRLASQTTIFSSAETKNGKVLKDISRISDLIFSKSNEYNSTHNAKKHPNDPKGKFSALSVLLSTASSKGRDLRILYAYESETFNCPPAPQDGESGTTDAGTPDTGTPDTGTPDTSPTDSAVDCSQYQAGASFPKWYVGKKADNKLCQAMYDKVYGTNGQTIICKTDADCKNPCRLLCCGDAGRLEQVLCKGGTCAFGITNKCNFCFSGENPESCTLPDEFKQP